MSPLPEPVVEVLAEHSRKIAVAVPVALWALALVPLGGALSDDAGAGARVQAVAQAVTNPESVATALGVLGSVISFVLWLPQARTTWANRRDYTALRGVSMGTMYLVLVNAATWGAYALVTGAFWAGAPGIVNAPLAAATIWMVLRARVLSQDRAVDLAENRCGCGWPADEPHDFFVTSPPGYGTVFSPCTGGNSHGFPIPTGTGEQARELFRPFIARDPAAWKVS